MLRLNGISATILLVFIDGFNRSVQLLQTNYKIFFMTFWHFGKEWAKPLMNSRFFPKKAELSIVTHDHLNREKDC